jgi:hypothetical protein
MEVTVVNEGPQNMVVSGPLSATAQIAVTGASALKARVMETAR